MVGTLLVLVGCAGAAAPPTPTPAVFSDHCESSAVVSWRGHWLVGDNEADKVLFEYDPAGRLIGRMALSIPIEDIEAIAGNEGNLLVVGSHSRNKHGEEKAGRQKMVHNFNREIHPALSGCAPCMAAAALAPNAGGLNIEGAAYVGGHLWLGLRAPLDGTKAILLNEGPDGNQLQRQVSIDLGGAGVRDLVPYKTGVLIVGGPVDDRGDDHSLWWLETMDATPKKIPVSLPPRTEGIALTPDGIFYVTDGDGKPGKCKTPSTWGTISLPLP